jgi:hypothetical protein
MRQKEIIEISNKTKTSETIVNPIKSPENKTKRPLTGKASSNLHLNSHRVRLPPKEKATIITVIKLFT